MSEPSWTRRSLYLPPRVLMTFARAAADYRPSQPQPPAVSEMPLRERDPALEEEARIAARLVRGFRAGAEECARCETEMIERYSRGLRCLLARRTGDDERARDLLQETLCIAIEKLRTTPLEKPERLAGYLRGIAVRVAANAGRRGRRESPGLDESTIEATPHEPRRQFQQVASEEARCAVRKVLQSMPVERDRELLIRFYVYDQDKQEICREMGLSSLHFNRVLFRAKNRFKKLLEESAGGADFAPSGGG